MVRVEKKGHTMNCQSIQKKISAYQDGELSSEAQAQIAIHLQDCSACRQQFTELEHAWQGLGQLSEIRPGPEFYTALHRKIKLESKHIFLPRLRSVFQLLPTPAAVFALLLIGLLAGTYAGNSLMGDGLWLLPHRDKGYAQGVTLASLRAFDPLPPGTLAEGYVRMANYVEVDR